MDSESPDVTFELNLLENGIDFILKGIDELFDEEHVLREYSLATDVSNSSYKYGVINLFSGFLLLLKERLSRHLSELIFKGKLKEVKNKIASGDSPNTVDLDEALERLEIAPRVTFSEDELRTIRAIQKIRNQFEHYKVAVNKHQLWKEVLSFLELIDKFLINELSINIESSAASLELQRKIHTIESVWQRIKAQRRQELLQKLENSKKEFEANREKIVKDLEQEYLSEKGSVQIYIECDKCLENTLIIYGEYKGVCINSKCGSVSSLTECNRCGCITIGFPWEEHVCDSCISWLVDQ